MIWDFLCQEMGIPFSFKKCFYFPDLCKTVVSFGAGNPLGFYE
jgi:hypothetical protein